MTALQTADRVLKTLFLLADSGAMSPRHVAGVIGVSRATAYNLLESLEQHGLAVIDGESGRYRLGPAVYRLSTSPNGYLDLLTAARGPMERLRDTTTETASLHVLVGRERMCIERFESRHPLRRVGGLGERFPLNCGAASHVLLAWERPDVAERFLSGGPLTGLGRNSITDPEELRTELMSVRLRGYAMRKEDPTAGVGGLSVPVFGPDGGVLASLTVAWPTVRWNESVIMDWVPTLQAVSNEITMRMSR
jgi:DNA-binding IclR family transcriptional regulator